MSITTSVDLVRSTLLDIPSRHNDLPNPHPHRAMLSTRKTVFLPFYLTLFGRKESVVGKESRDELVIKVQT